MASASEEILDSEEKKKEVYERWYYTKTIEFFGRTTPIILQHQNGPCPFLAICNILLLKNKLGLSVEATHVSESELLKLVADSLMSSFSNDENLKTINDAIDKLPSLAKGLNVNIRFKRINDIELKKEGAIFSLLDIPLYHGWIIDPQDVETSNAIGSKSYDTLLENLTDLVIRTMQVNAMKNAEEEEHEPLIGSEVTETVDPKISYPGDWVTFEDDKVSHDEQMNPSEPQKHESKSETEVVKKSDGVHSDPEESSAHDVIPASSIKIPEAKASSSTSASSGNEGEVGITAREGELIQTFLNSNESQLTVYGLFCLQEGVKEGELCVLFGNNHLNTMLKHEGKLYVLANDVGYVCTPGVVWEKLSEVNGDTVYVNKNFKIYEPEIVPYTSDEDTSKKKNDDYLNRSDYTAAESSTDPFADLAKAFEEQVLEGKKWKQQEEENQPLRLTPPTFPSGFVVGPEAEYSVWPRNQPKKPSKKDKKKSKEKCKFL